MFHQIEKGDRLKEIIRNTDSIPWAEHCAG
jgi:hypothetical protein